ncbi:hypothetical protein [Streptomyces sp. NPDC005408]|uniref:hypothetical protein n=1 Tax=Streptomyces sp. NPDC005408 TaxID=3155341 RepID=UPI0033B4BFFD
MTDDTKHAKPDLTPQEESQQKTRDNIEGTYAGTDMLERLPEIFAPFGPLPPGRSVFGSTIFEERELNDMLDILESTNPSDLENAGEALEKATTALNKAAKELADFISKTDWKSDAATEFERYGTGVVKYTWELGAYANAAGAQMKVASTGLTSVRNAMPSRDDRDVPKRPDKFPPDKQTQDNPEYQKAVQKEKDRQEAINQMNRLASFYVVSKSALASQKEPTLPTALKAAVPRPTVGKRGVESADSSGDELSNSARQPTPVRESQVVGIEGKPRTDATDLATPTPSRDPSMEIDSVATPPATTTSPGATQIPSTTGPSSTGSGPVPPMVGKVGNPARTSPPRAAGTSGRVPKAVGGPGARAVGRPGTAGGGGSRAVGRPTAMGTGAGATGRGGGAATRGQSPVVGRPGAAGQPMPGRPGASAGPRSGRASGIVGGTPQRAASGSAGSRIPKGTVIGGEGTATGRSSTARPGQSGAIGANPAKSAARPTGRGTPSVNGVVGTPRGGASGRPTAGGAATEGSASLGARSNQRRPGDEEERTSSRPDYLTEDEETWAARRRGAVPPVID